MLPKFVIIGAQKSASTFIQACLADHPDIYIPHGETPFFESPDYEHSNIKELEKIFEGRSEKCVGIKRPTYLGKPEVPSRIRSHLPDAKLIAVLRNPIDRAISAYFHNINYGFIPPIVLETGMRKVVSDPLYRSKYRRSPEIIEFGYYYKYLSEYSHYMKNNRLLIFLHEDIISKPLESIQKAYDFLGVSKDFIPSSLNSRPQEVLYNLTRLRLITYRNRFIYDYNENRTRLFPRKMTAVDKMIAGAFTILDRKLLSKILPNNKPKVGLELQNILYDLYASDNEALVDFINRDLSAWKPCKETI
jgi:hypothetical protein